MKTITGCVVFYNFKILIIFLYIFWLFDSNIVPEDEVVVGLVAAVVRVEVVVAIGGLVVVVAEVAMNVWLYLVI